jgi:oxaloacetate decarboxylase beta subunit
VPIGTGILIGNIPFFHTDTISLQIGIYEKGSVLNYLYYGVTQGIYPPLIFLGIGAMTDFSSLISNPRLLLLGAAAQIGIFVTFLGALFLGFNLPEAASIGIIGGADGPTAIFLSSKLANGGIVNGVETMNLIGPIAIAAYSYMALVPVIQPPVMRLLTTKKERLIRMKPPRAVSRFEKIVFPILGLLLTTFISPGALPLLGMLFFGNLLRESGVTRRLADTAKTSLIDIVTIILGLTVGASTQADVFLTPQSIMIFGLGAFSFIIASAGGVLFAKLMNLFLMPESKINPLIGSAGVSAVPDSARVSEMEGLREDPNNHLLMHAMAPNVAGVIGSAVAAGILMSFLL